MINFIEFDKLSLDSFRILEVPNWEIVTGAGNNWKRELNGTKEDLTTAEYAYDLSPDYGNGGLRANPVFDIADIQNGKLFFTQITRNHTLNINFNNGRRFTFNANAEVFRDVHADNEFHFKKYDVTNNVIHNPESPLFYDAPFRALLEDYERVEFDILFETWVQYSEDITNNEIKPLFSFEWALRAVAEKRENLWILDESENYASSPEEIRESIVDRVGSPPLVTNELRILGTTVNEQLIEFLQHG